jgi:hypothetical protein
MLRVFITEQCIIIIMSNGASNSIDTHVRIPADPSGTTSALPIVAVIAVMIALYHCFTLWKETGWPKAIVATGAHQ